MLFLFLDYLTFNLKHFIFEKLYLITKCKQKIKHKTIGKTNVNAMVFVSEKFTLKIRFAATVIKTKLKTTIAEVKISSAKIRFGEVSLGDFKYFTKLIIGKTLNAIAEIMVTNLFQDALFARPNEITVTDKIHII